MMHRLPTDPAVVLALVGVALCPCVLGLNAATLLRAVAGW